MNMMRTTIKIKRDILTTNKKTGEKGHWGPKTLDTWEIPVDKLETCLKDAQYTGVHELLEADGYRPYADLDQQVEPTDDAHFERLKFDILNKAFEEFSKLFNKGETHMFCSSGQKSSGKWVVSAHFICNGIYYTNKQHIKYLMKTVDWKALGLDMDMSVYNKSKLMRLPYCKKPNDNRMLRHATPNEIAERVCYENDEFREEEIAEYGPYGLITAIDFDNDDYQLTPEGYVPKEEKKATEFIEEDTSTWSAERKASEKEKVKRMIEAMKNTRANTRDGWTKGVWAIRRIAQKMGMVNSFLELAHLFAKKTTEDNYDEDATGNLYMQEPTEVGVGYATLKRWADEDSPGWNGPIAPSEPTYYEDKYELLKTGPSKTQIQTWMLGCLAYVETTEQWFFRYRQGWQLMPKCPKKFPFSTPSTSSHIMIQGEKDKKIKLPFSDILAELKDLAEFEPCRYLTKEYLPYFKTSPKGIFNLFEGFAQKLIDETIPNDDADIAKVNAHLFDLAGRHQESYEYLLKWHAYLIQFPAEKMPLIIYYSKVQGIGKGIWATFLTNYILSVKNVMSLTDMKVILGHFNSAVTENLLTICEEAKDEGKSIGDSQALKEMITGKAVTTVKKGQEAEKTMNYSKFIINTNFKNCYDVEPSDRRAHLNECDVSHAGDLAYFEQLTKDILNHKTGEKYFNWLAQMDLSNFNPWKIPETKMKNDLKVLNMPHALRHIKEVVEGRRLDMDEHCVLSTKELYYDFQQFCKDEGIMKPVMLKTYKETLANALNLEAKQHRVPGGERVRGYKLIFSDIDEAFKSYLRMKHSILEKESDD